MCEVQIIQKFCAGRVIAQLAACNDNSVDSIVHCCFTCIETSNTTPCPYGNFLTVDSSWQNWGTGDMPLKSNTWKYSATLQNYLGNTEMTLEYYYVVYKKKKKLKNQKKSNTICVKGFAKTKYHLWGEKFCENKTPSMEKIMRK